ncbi:MAG: alpha/beta fold hydrolase [Pseudolabrys sp.]
MVSFDSLPPALQDEIRSHPAKLNLRTARTDLAAILNFCRGEPVDDGPAGSVGFCMGGRIAFQAASEFPGRFRANASLHGTFLVNDAPDSAHRLVPNMRGEFYCGFGALDRFATPEIIAAIDLAFQRQHAVAYRRNVHAGANHGYALPDRDLHDRAATEADWREIFAMFARHLASSAPSGPIA